jgi:hypothetical protein
MNPIEEFFSKLKSKFAVAKYYIKQLPLKQTYHLYSLTIPELNAMDFTETWLDRFGRLVRVKINIIKKLCFLCFYLLLTVDELMKYFSFKFYTNL